MTATDNNTTPTTDDHSTPNLRDILAVYAALDHHGGIEPDDLHDLTGVPTSAATLACEQLREAGLAEIDVGNPELGEPAPTWWLTGRTEKGETIVSLPASETHAPRHEIDSIQDIIVDIAIQLTRCDGYYVRDLQRRVMSQIRFPPGSKDTDAMQSAVMAWFPENTLFVATIGNCPVPLPCRVKKWGDKKMIVVGVPLGADQDLDMRIIQSYEDTDVELGDACYADLLSEAKRTRERRREAFRERVAKAEAAKATGGAE